MFERSLEVPGSNGRSLRSKWPNGCGLQYNHLMCPTPSQWILGASFAPKNDPTIVHWCPKPWGRKLESAQTSPKLS